MLVSLGAALSWGSPAAYGQADATVPDPDPELERRALQLPDGFEVNLFAADPLLAKPIQMNFDPAGRLWVACSETYPQIKPGQKANDKIVVLEDTRGVGRADRVTVFADGLLIPTGLEPGDGGVYVGASTELLHLSRPQGDKGALHRRVVLSGFGTEDTHHMVHTLRWGPDGMLYFNQSIYIHSHIETPYGVRRLGGGGIWQFRPQADRLEIFARGWINSWGHHFDRWGQSFVTDGAGGEGVNYCIPGASYTATPGATRMLTGLNPGHPKYCGCEILSGRHLPEPYRGTLVTNDFRAHRVCRFSLWPEGSGYTARQEADLVRTTHPAFRPVDVKMGPDGAIYIADWYNPIIQHGEVDFRDPRRDQTHGRIWRLTARGRPLVPRPKLVGATTAELLEALRAPEDWTRHNARRVLQERGATVVVPELADWTARLRTTERPPEPVLLEALWTCQALDVVEPVLLRCLLAASDHRVRAAAVRVAGAWHDRLPNVLALLAPRAADEHPQVRLEAVRALVRLADVQAAELAVRVLRHPIDDNLDYAVWLTLRELEAAWLPALEAGRFPADADVRELLFVLGAVDSARCLPTLVRLAKSGTLHGESEEAVLRLLIERGGPAELALAFERTVGTARAPGRCAPLLGAMEQAARQRGVRPAVGSVRLAPLLKADDLGLRAASARLAGAWKLEGLRPDLVHMARDGTAAEPLRQAAVDGLAALGGSASAASLCALIDGNTPQPLRRHALVTLVGLDGRAAASRVAPLLARVSSDDEAGELFAAFLERKGGEALLTEAIQGHRLPADVAKVGVRLVRTAGRPAPRLVEELTRAGNLASVNHTLAPRQMARMVADVARAGNPARGEAVFRRSDLLCLQCHAIGGAGGQVGPDLSSIGASAPVDYLIDSLLLPNKAVKENYHALLVTTASGRQYTGIKVRQTPTEMILRTAEDRELSVPLKDIEEQANGGSLMPEGLTDPLTRREMLDLVRFLSELGKAGPYAVSPARVVRTWEVLASTRDNEQVLARRGPGAAAAPASALAWAPAYSRVAGDLPVGELPRLRSRDGRAVAVVRWRLQTTSGGRVRLRLQTPAGSSLWIDEKPVKTRSSLDLDCPAGVHVLTLSLPAPGQQPLRVELDDAPGSAARCSIVGGK
jgi:putative heme-binding domain-containing protein